MSHWRASNRMATPHATEERTKGSLRRKQGAFGLLVKSQPFQPRQNMKEVASCPRPAIQLRESTSSLTFPMVLRILSALRWTCPDTFNLRPGTRRKKVHEHVRLPNEHPHPSTHQAPRTRSHLPAHQAPSPRPPPFRPPLGGFLWPGGSSASSFAAGLPRSSRTLRRA